MLTMRAIAISVLVLGISGTATADLFGRGDCTPVPTDSPFDPVGCRLWHLGTSTSRTLERGPLWVALDRASWGAWDRIFAASDACEDAARARVDGRDRAVVARTRRARRKLLEAASFLSRYVARLTGPSADGVIPEARAALLTEAVTITAEVTALRARLDTCPPDA
jgi:hypothetical protein